jgi:hypothetical protein
MYGEHESNKRVFVLDEISIILPRSVLTGASTAFKRELASLLGLEELAAGSLHAGRMDETDSDEWGLANLDPAAARLFLAGCGERTVRVLTLIVHGGGRFSLRELERASRSVRSGLKGVWTGLTKRTRTITGDPDAYLIRWTERNGQWEGSLSQVTQRSFQLVLE